MGSSEKSEFYKSKMVNCINAFLLFLNVKFKIYTIFIIPDKQ